MNCAFASSQCKFFIWLNAGKMDSHYLVQHLVRFYILFSLYDNPVSHKYVVANDRSIIILNVTLLSSLSIVGMTSAYI